GRANKDEPVSRYCGPTLKFVSLAPVFCANAIPATAKNEHTAKARKRMTPPAIQARLADYDALCEKLPVLITREIRLWIRLFNYFESQPRPCAGTGQNG